MDNYDVAIVGAATSGSYLGRKLAEQGFSVLVIDKLTKKTLGKRLDIFHVAKDEFKRFGIPEVKKGDKEWAFEFSENYTVSPTDKYPKRTGGTTVGMHMSEYIAKMNRWAEEKGAKFVYGAEFKSFVFENDKIVGFIYQTADGENEVRARVVVDASGAVAAARSKLPESYGMENFPLTDRDKFYVVLRYVKLLDEKDYTGKDGNRNYTKASFGCPYFKTWLAPQADDKGCIIGIGACNSYDYAEKIYSEYEKSINLPRHEITHFERGTTPYTRPPYSFVADGFIATGDAGCLTKPNNGEGVTSSMVQMEIVADVLGKVLKGDGYVSRENLWDINARYNKVQGADFVSTRAILTKAVCATKDEFEYFFKHDIIFSEKFLDNANSGPEIKITLKDYLQIGWGIVSGLLSGKLSLATLKNLLDGLTLGGKLKELYLNFPLTPKGYEEWTEKADELWAKVGKMS